VRVNVYTIAALCVIAVAIYFLVENI